MTWSAGRRSRQRIQEEQRERENVQRAGSAYEAPNPEDLDGHQEMSGLPWGGLSLKHVFETGRAKEEKESQRTSREGSVPAAPPARAPTQ